MSGLRQDMIQSAVAFLRDQSVGSSPLAKRIAFLEAKGLSQAEIDEAFRQASAGPAYGYNTATVRYSPAAAQQGRDWRDWFIMTVVSGSVGYLVISLARRYLIPALQPPTESQLVEAQSALTAKYDEAAAILHGLQTETEAVKANVAEQSQKVDEGLSDLRKAVAEMRESERKRDELVHGCREEVEAIRNLLPRMVEKQQDAQTSALGDLQQELKSLKSILLSRRAAATAAAGTTSNGAASANGDAATPRGTGTGSASPSPFSGVPPRPAGIPAWQLASSTSAPALSSVAKATTGPVEGEAATDAAATSSNGTAHSNGIVNG